MPTLLLDRPFHSSKTRWNRQARCVVCYIRCVGKTGRERTRERWKRVVARESRIIILEWRFLWFRRSGVALFCLLPLFWNLHVT